MQTNINKYILLAILILTSVTLSAQTGTKKYVTKTGDTTIVVMAGTRGLRGADAAFLRDNKVSNEFDSKHNRYKILKDAAQETEQVSSIVDIEKERVNPTSGSLSFRIAKQNIDYLKRDQEAQKRAKLSLNDKNASVGELTYLYEKFGNQPSYFVNGIQVDKQKAASLSDKDILTRSHKVSNTSTGNPNGEVWYVVNSTTFARLNIDSNAFEESYAHNDRAGAKYTEPSPSVLAPRPAAEQKVSTPRAVPAQTESDSFWSIQESERSAHVSQQQPVLQPSRIEQSTTNNPTLSPQQREVEDLERQIRELQGYKGSSEQVAVATPTASTTYREPAPQPQPRPATQQTRAYRPEPEIVSFKDSPQERLKRERDLIEQQQQKRYEAEQEEVITVSNQASTDEIFADPNITKETPIRSIRRIKDRERNK